MIAEDEVVNFEAFRDCLSTAVIEKFAKTEPKIARKRVKGRKNEKTGADEAALDEDHTGDAAELSEFVDVCLKMSPNVSLHTIANAM
jgi:hypothetical protein